MFVYFSAIRRWANVIFARTDEAAVYIDAGSLVNFEGSKSPSSSESYIRT